MQFENVLSHYNSEKENVISKPRPKAGRGICTCVTNIHEAMTILAIIIQVLFIAGMIGLSAWTTGWVSWGLWAVTGLIILGSLRGLAVVYQLLYGDSEEVYEQVDQAVEEQAAQAK